MTNTHEQLKKDYLTLGNRYKTLVKIRYQYLKKTFGRVEREGYIQPLEFMIGEKGLHVLAWDVERQDYRRFAVANIMEVSLTDMQWSPIPKKAKQKIAK
jgi:predicted DNA-binding transcriptional regulator YafY